MAKGWLILTKCPPSIYTLQIAGNSRIRILPLLVTGRKKNRNEGELEIFSAEITNVYIIQCYVPILWNSLSFYYKKLKLNSFYNYNLKLKPNNLCVLRQWKLL